MEKLTEVLMRNEVDTFFKKKKKKKKKKCNPVRRDTPDYVEGGKSSIPPVHAPVAEDVLTFMQGTIDTFKIIENEELLNEKITKPTSADKKAWKKRRPNAQKLYLVVKGEEGMPLGYVDDVYMTKMRAKSKNKKMKPAEAAKIRLHQVHYFKRK